MNDEAWFKIDATVNHLRVESFGQRSQKASEEMWRAVSEASAESGINKILLLSYRDGSLPVNVMLAMAQNIHVLFTSAHKIAIVFSASDFPRESVAETVSRIGGLNLRAFKRSEEALEWLLSDDERGA